jgi:hypothetical protein
VNSAECNTRERWTVRQELRSQDVESNECEHSRCGQDMQYIQECDAVLAIWSCGWVAFSTVMARVPERITHAPQSCLTGWVDGRCRLVLGSRSTRPPLSTKFTSTSPQGWRGRRTAKQCDLPRKLCSATSVTTFTVVHERGLGGSRHGDRPVNWCLVRAKLQILSLHCVHPSPRTSERQGPALIWPLVTIPKPMTPDDVRWRSLSYHAHHSCTANSTSSEAANRYTVCM